MPKKTPKFALLKVQVFEDCNLCDFATYSSLNLDSFIGCFFKENIWQTHKPGPNCRVRLALKRDKDEKEKDTETQSSQ